MAYSADKEPTGLTAKTTPVDADVIVIGDSADASEVAKKVTGTNFKAYLKTYFDTLYASTLGADDNYVTDAEKTKLGYISVTQAVDLDSIESLATAALPASSYDDATAGETNTGTSTSKYVSPDALAGSNFGIRYVQCTLNGTTALTTSEKVYFRIPAALTGMNLVSVTGTVGTGAAGSSSSGTPTFTVKNVTDNNQMLSTSLTIDANEYTSATAASAVAINGSFDDVVTDDLIEVAVTTSGTGVTFCTITLGFALP